MTEDIERVLFSQEELARIVKDMGAQISKDYASADLLLLGVLKGSVVFMADLMRAITVPCTIDFLAVSSYGNDVTGGEVKWTKFPDVPLQGKDVLVVEDILDSGTTMAFLLRYLSDHHPRSVRTCVLLDKPEARKADVTADYVGARCPCEFVVGYGLDYAQQYRHLPFLGVLKPAVYASSSEKTKELKE